MNAGARIAAAAVAAAFALAGCALGTTQKPMTGQAKNGMQRTAPCNAGTCKIPLWVECRDGNCSIHSDSEFLAVASGKKPSIVWELVKSQGSSQPSPDFRFAQNGIDFGADAAQEFSGCAAQGNGRQYSCKDNQTNRPGETTVWKYTISVVDETGARAVPPYDPWVINN